VVVGIVTDYVIRPRLVGSEQGVPAILTFIALFGGVEVFGVIGLILGPVIATLSWAVLQTYAHDVASGPAPP
jgi:predicted PurR-regulated permease PerM